MALWSIPVNFGSPDFNLQIDLDDVTFGMRFIYNARTDRFSMQIQDSTGAPLVSGLALVSDWLTLARFKDASLPAGRLFMMDITGTETEPNQITFGDTVLLCYEDAVA